MRADKLQWWKQVNLMVQPIPMGPCFQRGRLSTISWFVIVDCFPAKLLDVAHLSYPFSHAASLASVSMSLRQQCTLGIETQME